MMVLVIGTLSAAVIVMIRPGKNAAEHRNATRVSDVVTIANAVYQYSVANNSALPASITTTPTEACKTGGTCAGLVDLGVLTAGEKYLASMPRDPKCGTTTTENCNVNGTGYQVSRSTAGRITVTATGAENGRAISTTK